MKNLIGGILVALTVFLAGCASAPPAAVGAWDIELNTPLGALPAVLVISEDGTGSMSSDMGSQPISGIIMEGNAVSFNTAIEAQGQSINLSFAGTVDGDSMNGEFGSDFGAFGVTGSRQ